MAEINKAKGKKQAQVSRAGVECEAHVRAASSDVETNHRVAYALAGFKGLLSNKW